MLGLLFALTLNVHTPTIINEEYAADEGYLYKCGEVKKGDKTIKFLRQFEHNLNIAEEEPDEDDAEHFTWYLTWKIICSHKVNIN